MKKGSVLIFDEHISGNTTTYTSSKHNARLGDHDQISLQVLVDRPSTTGYLSVQLEHSADELNFVGKGIPIVSGPLTANQKSVLTGVDPGTSPNLRYVRFAISMTTTSRAHVRIFATMRDQG